MIADTLTTVERLRAATHARSDRDVTGAQSKPLLRADSAYFGYPTIVLGGIEEGCCRYGGAGRSRVGGDAQVRGFARGGAAETIRQWVRKVPDGQGGTVELHADVEVIRKLR